MLEIFFDFAFERFGTRNGPGIHDAGLEAESFFACVELVVSSPVVTSIPNFKFCRALQFFQFVSFVCSYIEPLVVGFALSWFFVPSEGVRQKKVCYIWVERHFEYGIIYLYQIFIMHNLVVFVIFLGIISVLGVYMFREGPYLVLEEDENV